jgi:hypothetical protein
MLRNEVIRLIALALLAALAGAGCAPTLQCPSGCAPGSYSRLIAQQRACESGAAAGVWWVLHCYGMPQLPTTCEKPGTEQRPECRKWVQEAYPVPASQATMLGIDASL